MKETNITRKMEMKRGMTNEIKIYIFDKDGGLKRKKQKNSLILFFDLWREKDGIFRARYIIFYHIGKGRFQI